MTNTTTARCARISYNRSFIYARTTVRQEVCQFANGPLTHGAHVSPYAVRVDLMVEINAELDALAASR